MKLFIFMLEGPISKKKKKSFDALPGRPWQKNGSLDQYKEIDM